MTLPHEPSPMDHWLQELIVRRNRRRWLLLCICLILLASSVTLTSAQEIPPSQSEEIPSHPLPITDSLDILPAPANVHSDRDQLRSSQWAPEYAGWSRLVYQSARNENDWEIYRADGSGEGATNLTNHRSSDIHPRLNRDGSQIVFASNREGNFDIYVMGMYTDGRVHRLTDHGASDIAPVWSPDGNQLLFQSYRDGQAEIYRINADGSNQQRLTFHDDFDGEPAYAPDGNQIAFTRRAGGQYRIWVMSTDGSNQRQLSYQPYSENPIWSPDGSKIAYDADANGNGWQELWVMDADGGNQHELFNNLDHQTDHYANSWSPDGRFIAFTRVAFVMVDGDWYWTDAYLDATEFPFSDVWLRLSDSGADWNPDWQSLDWQPPTAQIYPLPGISPASFSVHWSGWDDGPAGLATFDVQMRDGENGNWMDWHPATTSQVADYTGLGGHTYYFRMRARDRANNVGNWSSESTAFTTVDSTPPITSIRPLPSHLRAPQFVVRWDGSDPGGAGIQSYDVQVRQDNGPWADWITGNDQTSASFSGVAGSSYEFRVRGRDAAQNQEDWPDRPDAVTRLYAWAISGKIANNRGAPVSGAAVTTVPATSETVTSAVDGAYTAWVDSPADSYAVTWGKPAYAILPSTFFSQSQDAQMKVVLPPVDNAVIDPGFESKDAAWQFSGALEANIQSEERHSGDNAAFLGSKPVVIVSGMPLVILSDISHDHQQGGLRSTIYTIDPEAVAGPGRAQMSQTVQLPVTLTAPTLSFMHDFSADFPSASRLEVVVHDAITATTIFSTTTSADAWRHAWADLTPWAGQSVTITFQIVEEANGAHARACIDEVSVGSAHPDAWVRQAGPTAALPGTQFERALVYGNRGGVTASNTHVTLQLPPKLTFVSADPPPSATTPELRWEVGDLSDQGGPGTIQVKLQVDASAVLGTKVTTTVAITSGTAEIEQANNSAQLATFVGHQLYLPGVWR